MEILFVQEITRKYKRIVNSEFCNLFMKQMFYLKLSMSYEHFTILETLYRKGR